MMERFENYEEPLFPISTAAKLLKISVHTLRMYEKEGLILPFKKETRHRLYSKSDIDRLNCIRNAINELKISIEGIKTIYSLIPCWEVKNCTEEDRKNCEAYNSHSKPCWSYKHNGNYCSDLECRNCVVYKNYSECGNIKESIRAITRKK